ncbi:MAG TPA: non-homologous end-joining DNA ligase [Syntrophorhabdaceae bacterium]|nr:non-homologous end-joining DNA ligase [Syntrophorhabdaceae bacterium]
MALKDYRSKRDFDQTPEPPPGLPNSKHVESAQQKTEPQLIFVVHEHAARALHYDLRLEMEGVLKSWAVPKGPTLDPAVKRLAVMVEDHPFDYKDFEGVIPEGNYGAGNVIIWDRGIYHSPSDHDGKHSEATLLEGLRKGNLKFVLHGEKLNGEFALVKTRQSDRSWLLIKKKDRFATDKDILDKDHSVVSDATVENVSEGNPSKWETPDATTKVRIKDFLPQKELTKAKLSPMPHHISPMLATLVKDPFDDDQWVYEVKWDGYRAIAEIKNKAVVFYSRNQLSFEERFSPIMDSLKTFDLHAILDGEVVVIDSKGFPDFQMLQDYRTSRKGQLLYCVFDLLYYDGRDLTGLSLLTRKDLLKKILPVSKNIKYSEHVAKDGILFFQVVKEKGLEGIVAKHSLSTYQMGKRSREWLKIKAQLTQDAIIAGFTEPKGTRKDFGALVLGVYKNGELVFIGHAGGGFSAKKLKEIHAQLKPLIRKKTPFKVAPKTNTPVTWLKPEKVCEVAFHGWTTEGIMRQPVFMRMREDKPASEVIREEPSV